MPPGDLLTAAYQVELRGLLMGDGDPFTIGPGAIGGLGSVKVKSNRVDLDHADGSYGTPSYLASPVITVPIVADIPGDGDAVMDAWRDLMDAWTPDTGTSEELHMWVPGWGHIYVIGNTDGLDDDLSLVQFGSASGLGTFTALDPTIHTAGS